MGFLGKPISKAIGPRIKIHMAVWRPKWSARKPMRNGNNFARGAITEPSAMMLALCPGRLEYNLA